MALRRRSGAGFTANIWPGFVDAMTALLLVLMFVLTIFMVMQFVLQETINGQDRRLNELGSELATLAEALGLEQQRSDQLETDNVDLTGSLTESEAIAETRRLTIAALEADVNDSVTRIASFEAQMASLLARNSDLDTALTASRSESADRADQLAATSDELTASTEEITRLRDANAEVITRAEALQLALAQARTEIDGQTETARLAAAQREALEALIADLQTQASTQQASLADLSLQLDASVAEGEARASRITELAAALDSTTTERDALTQTGTDLRAEIDGLETRLTAEEQARLEEQAAILSLQQRLETTSTERDTLTQAGTDLRAEIDELKTRLTAEEQARLEEQAAIASLRARLDTSETALSDEERARLEEAAAAERLREQLANSEGALTEAERTRLTEAAATEALRARLSTADTELTAMTLALEQQRQQAEDTLTLLAAAESARALADTARADELSELERQRALLAQANNLLTEQRSETTTARREMALLNQQSAALRQQLSSLQTLLDESNARDTDNEVRIEALGSQLNTALAQVAAEQRRRADLLEDEAEQLRQYRSEFFGRMRELLGNQDGVRVVGDRFVFSSEVLFEPGSASLGFDGRGQITSVARVIQGIADEIPEDIDWILQVNGHTDRIPVGVTAEYADNWELSQARALSVVRYLSDVEGIAPNRLAAAGFGEFQPIDDGTSFEALARNRRIELKFTER